MKRKLNLIVMLAVISAAFSAIQIKAQQAEKIFKVGDRVEVNIANDIVNENDWRKGTVTQINYTDDGRILSYMVKRDDLTYQMQFGNNARVIRPSNAAVTETPEIKPTNETAPASQSEPEEMGECSFEKYSEVKADDKFSNELIKKALYEFYASQANTGGLTSPGAIGVSFLSIKLGKSYANTVTNPQRRQDGAPVGATIYSFAAKYIVCKKYANETVRTQYENDFVCFKDNGGNWSCPPDGVPKITYPK